MNQKKALQEALDEIQKNLTEIQDLKATVETLKAANASFVGGMRWRNGLIRDLSLAVPKNHPDYRRLIARVAECRIKS